MPAQSPIDIRHVGGLNYCRQTVHEAMRLFPPTPGIGRLPNTAMTVAGMRISTRTRIHISIFALRRNVRLWDNPTAFDPDRFAADESKTCSRYAYLPFGRGPRVCIGASVATIEATVILAFQVRAFRFQSPAAHKPKPVARVTLRPAGGMPLLIAACERSRPLRTQE